MLRLFISFFGKEENIQRKKFYNYYVYENGDVYSLYRNKFLKPGIVQGYKQYTLSINGISKRYKAHRLVALLFLNVPDNYEQLVVNHKDGNKLNCHYSNLEWCTTSYNNYHARINNLNNISESNKNRWDNEDFRKQTSKHISEGLLRTGANSGKNNSRFRYEIFDYYGNEYNRHSLSDLLGLSISYTDSLIKKYVDGFQNKYFVKFGIYIKDMKSKVNRLSNALC